MTYTYSGSRKLKHESLKKGRSLLSSAAIGADLDPENRLHWRATARTGELHSKVYEPTSLAGATVLLDFHQDGYPRRNEPHRSELAITTAALPQLGR